MAEEVRILRERLARQRLMIRHLAKHIPFPGEESVNRAGGGAICDLCGLELRDHPECTPECADGMLTILCDGRFVKL